MSALVYTIKKVLNFNSQDDFTSSKNSLKAAQTQTNVVNIKARSTDITREQRFWDMAVPS
ncbi:hypothetical protein [Sporomusa aerivorans]|uniref:hypothetical protein n=1 Tax=Sporomusa aerivorans TaxID=204936 RepID=UPI00352AE861